jgi:DNA polymerase II small subunit
MSEPQPMLDKEYAKAIYDLPNVFIVSNPGIVRIHKSEKFSGFDVLLYHGYSFDYFIREVESIRNNGGYDRADLMMKFLLQRRHLAPTHGSTLYIPSEDNLIIKQIPDFFVTGHIHKVSISNYKTVTTICGSCWQRKTAFQEKVGHHPEPGKVPIVNLRTRAIKVLNFGDE